MALKDDLQKYLDDACKSGGYDLMVAMLTVANGSGSYIIPSGNRKNIVSNCFKISDNFVDGLVSRKKQLLPGIITALENK